MQPNQTIQSIRSKRIAEEISGVLLARKAQIDRCRLSLLENGHVRLQSKFQGRFITITAPDASG